MSQTSRIRTLLRQTRLMDKLERSFSTDIRREKNNFIEAQADNFSRSRSLSIDLLAEHQKQLKIIFKKHYARIIRVFSGDTLRNFPKAKSFTGYEKKLDLFSLLLQEWTIEEGADKIKGIAETTYNDLRTVMVASITASEPAQTIIQNLLSVRGFSAFRANTIARTETHNAAMFASKRTAESLASDVDIQILKKWIPALDERTRVNHAAMVGHKPVSMDGKFLVGGERMDRPGDPSASPGNVINCRCVLVYEPKEG